MINDITSDTSTNFPIDVNNAYIQRIPATIEETPNIEYDPYSKSMIKESINNIVSDHQNSLQEENFFYDNYETDDDDNSIFIEFLLFVCIIFSCIFLSMIIFVSSYHYALIKYTFITLIIMTLIYPRITDHIYWDMYLIQSNIYNYIKRAGIVTKNTLFGTSIENVRILPKPLN